MNYRKGFWRLGVVLTLAEIAIFVGLAIWGALILPMFEKNVYNDWPVFRHAVWMHGVLPVAGYWLLYLVLGWVITGFKSTGKSTN
jgi:hypothetical protein